jgi:hypothetical protein
MHINLSQVVAALNPLQPPEMMFAGIAIYVIAILAFICLMLQGEGSTRDTIFLSIVIFSCLIDKIVATSALRDTIPGFDHASFGVFMIRVADLVFPMIVAGSTKSEKSRIPLILTGLIGGAYLFTRWFFEIRPQ